jgi:ubiquinol-cytochrome c reductase subunit 7
MIYVLPRYHSFNINYTGLQYEDLLNSAKPDIAEALELADPDVIKGRLRRLKRASDLTFKAKNLADYAPNAKLDPWKVELYDDIKSIEARNDEYGIVNLHRM